MIARVLVCDDSLVIRGVLGRLLSGVPGFVVAGTVADGAAAVALVRERLDTAPVDVVVLDIEMPVMDGLTALPLLLGLDPRLRVIVASTLTTRGAAVAMRALELGAADYLPKPSASALFGDRAFADELIARVRGFARLRADAACMPAPSPTVVRRPTTRDRPARPVLLAVGSSTGGPQALFTFFRALGRPIGVPVLLTQHMPVAFVPMLAAQIDRLGGLGCSVAIDGEALRADHVLVAPGDRHLVVERSGEALVARLSDAPAENFCRPAVDVMLRSVARNAGGPVLVAMLTGMGQDGLIGTGEVVAAGGSAVVQDEATSVVWGMPGAIARAGLADAVLPLGALAPAVRERLRSPRHPVGA